MTELEKAYKYCESVTRLHAKSFYFAATFLPKPKRRAVYPIYAFCRHVDDEIDEIGDSDESEAIRVVEKWKAKLETVYFNAKSQSRKDAEEEGEKRRKGEEETDESEICNLKSEIDEDRRPKTENRKLVFLAWQDLLKTYKIPRELPLELMRAF